MKINIKTSLILCMSLILLGIISLVKPCYAETMGNNMIFKTGISLIEQVPDSFMGIWRVSSKLSETSDYKIFKQNSLDIWNLSRSHDVIKLSNPFSGAEAKINVSYVSNNVIKFTKIGNYDSKRLTDTVEVRLNGDSFKGINRLKLETLSDIDKSVLKSQTAVYTLNGEKISGNSVLEK